jgi:negative regulator of replication initiation
VTRTIRIDSEVAAWIDRERKQGESANDVLKRALDNLRDSLAWALDRVVMPGCCCSTGSDGACTCDFESWPAYKALRKAQAACSQEAAHNEETCGCSMCAGARAYAEEKA